ncbi:MAG: hypothetical protein GY861_25850 [bacterium]|nr:hypothetical protein [bacterium]
MKGTFLLDKYGQSYHLPTTTLDCGDINFPVMLLHCLEQQQIPETALLFCKKIKFKPAVGRRKKPPA